MSQSPKDLRNRALRLLATREYSAAELTRKLARPPPPKRARRGNERAADTTAAPSASLFPDAASALLLPLDAPSPCIDSQATIDDDAFETVSPQARTPGKAGSSAPSPAQPKAERSAAFEVPEHSKREQVQVRTAAAAQVVNEFASLGYQSDTRYAESQARRLAGQMSQRALRQALLGAGVDAEVAAAAMEEHAVDDLQAAHALWARKFGQAPADDKARAKQIRFLQSRGFGFATISKVLRDAGVSVDEA